MNDMQYLEFRNCQNQIINVKYKDYIGFNTDPYNCDSYIMWFERDVDFTLIEFDPFEIEVNREDVDSNLPLSQTKGTYLNWTGEFPIQATEGSRLLQFIHEINSNEYTNGDKGEGIIAYSNGGVHYQRDIIYDEGAESEFKLSKVYLNLKSESWIDAFSGDYQSDTEHDLSVMIENYPVYFTYGSAPLGFALPTNLTPPEVSHDDLTFEDDVFTIINLVLTDTDMLTYSDSVYVEIYDTTTFTKLDEQLISSGNDYTFTTDGSITNITYNLSYPISPKSYLPFESGNIDNTITPPAI